MAKRQTDSSTLEQLRADNERLRAENEQLRRVPVSVGHKRSWGSFGRSFGAVVFAAFAVALLVVGSLLFWTGNTIVDNERFDQAVTPIIRNATVQQAVTDYTTSQLYANVDVTTYVQDALPPRAEFLAPTIADQLQGQTEKVLQEVLARPQFQDRWNTLLSSAHAEFINTVKQSGGNGTIDLNDLYQQLGSSLQDTRLSFLADKQLPPKVGTVQVASGDWIQPLHNLIVHIDTWRTLAILLFLLCSGLAIFLAHRRRHMVISLALYSAAALLVTLIALRIMRENLGANVDAQYVDAVRQSAQIILHPLVVQTATLMSLFVLIAAVAWLTGHGRSAQYVQGRVQLLLAGKLHHAIFGEHENGLTRWVGRYKRILQWMVVIIAALLLLVVAHLTVQTLIVYALVALLLVLIVELIGVPASQQKTAE